MATKIKEVKMNELKKNDWNPNEMDQTNMKYLKQSLQMYGYNQLIVVDENNIIIDGEHRYKALLELLPADDTIKVIELSGYSLKSKQALAISMNKIKGYLKNEDLAQIIHDINPEEDVLPFSTLELSTLDRMYNAIQDNLGSLEADVDAIDKIAEEYPQRSPVGESEVNNLDTGNNVGGATNVNGQTGFYLMCSQPKVLELIQIQDKLGGGENFATFIIQAHEQKGKIQ
jgi:hypothetical protein